VSNPPSGTQFEIRHGAQRATVVEVGGGIRELTVGGRDLLHPYPLDAICDGAHGTPLIPWPNRLEDGWYSFDGEDFQVALTEPAQHNAIHGFLRWRSWQAVEHAEDRVVMGIRLQPMASYPFTLDVEVAYSLGPDGLVVSTTATNLGARALPYGCGQHPYLSPGPGALDDCTLHLDAATRIVTDERQLPIGTEAVEGTPFDFRQPRQLGNLVIDHAFTDLARDDRGRAWVRLGGTDGAEAAMWVDEHHPYLEIYTADTLSGPRRRSALGAEPMTCPPNALRSGQDVIRLEPGRSITTSWGAVLVTT